MDNSLNTLKYTIYEYIDWLTPKLSAFENWLYERWSQFQFDPRQIELAAL